MAAHRYWRLDLTGPYYVAIGEVEMHTSVGGADVCTGGTPSSSGHFGGGVPANAFDNNDSTYWETSSGTGPYWLAYDFGAGVTKDIIEFSFKPSTSYWNAEYPSTVQLKYSDDGSTWTAATAALRCDFTLNASSRNQTDSSTNNSVFRVATATKTYWRINVSATQAGTNTSIGEWELRSSAGGANLATASGQISATQTNFGIGGFTPANAIDGNAATYWDDGKSVFPRSIIYRFVSDTNIVQYVLRATTPSDYQKYAPKSWTLEYSGDGVTWTVADMQTSVAAWSNGESRTYTLVGVASARPVVFVAT